MNVTAKSMGMKLPQNFDDNVLETTVHLIGDMKELDLGIKVNMKVKVEGVSKEDLEKIVAKSREICPYSRALKDNVVTSVEVEAI